MNAYSPERFKSLVEEFQRAEADILAYKGTALRKYGHYVVG